MTFSAAYLKRFTIENRRYSDPQVMATLKQSEGGVHIFGLFRDNGTSSVLRWKR